MSLMLPLVMPQKKTSQPPVCSGDAHTPRTLVLLCSAVQPAAALSLKIISFISKIDETRKPYIGTHYSC